MTEVNEITDDERNAIENRIYKLQHEMIKEKYGEEIAAFANYGWAVEETANGVGVMTKIYLNPGFKLLDSAGTSLDNIKHEWMDW